jgi:hypothetical protein
MYIYTQIVFILLFFFIIFNLQEDNRNLLIEINDIHSAYKNNSDLIFELRYKNEV